MHLVDVDRNRYQLRNYQHRTATLARWDYDDKAWVDERRTTVAKIDEMQAEIIHHRSYGQIPFSGILAFSFHRFTRLAYLKTLLARGKGRLVSSFFASKELKSRRPYRPAQPAGERVCAAAPFATECGHFNR